MGDQALGVDVLRRALSRGSMQEASERLIADARLALESTAQKPERAQVIERGALLRGLVDAMRRESLARAEPRNDELEEVSKSLWMQVDRPRCVRTVNIMAMVPELAEGEREQRVMRRIADEVRGSATPEELAARVGRADKEGLDVQVMLAPPLTADGRVFVETPADANGPFPPLEYAQAAAALTHVGETSDVVATAAGYHVLMAIGILPPLVVDEAERTRRLRVAVADRRIAAELEQLRRDLPHRTTIWQNPHRSTLTSLVWRTTQSGQ